MEALKVPKLRWLAAKPVVLQHKSLSCAIGPCAVWLKGGRLAVAAEVLEALLQGVRGLLRLKAWG